MPRASISLAQMTIVLGDVRKNTEQAEKMMTEAARRGSHLVVFPELWSTGYALERGKELAAELNSGIFAHMTSLSVQNKIAFVGSMLEKRGVHVSNSAAVIFPNGKIAGVYRKIHLFRLMDEDRWLQPGNAPLLQPFPWGDCGIAICYDLRFPELFRKYAVQGAKMMILPAEWPIERIEHWRTLVIARAIENQCYVVAVNACGYTGGTTFGGHSMVVDPWGKIVVEAGETPTLLTVEIDTDAVDSVRAKMSVLDDRRPDMY